MPAVTLKWRTPAFQTAQNCEECVSERQSCNQQRKNQRCCGGRVCAFGRDEIEAEESDAEPQRGTAGITHKNSRGRKIEDEECDAGAEQAPGERVADCAER